MWREFTQAYLLSLSYDGSSFKGWIKQPSTRTVQQTLEDAIKHLIKKVPFKVLGASKTDHGVHALDQKVLLQLDFEISNLTSFLHGLNKKLPLDVCVNTIQRVANDFNVRQVVQKTYCYTINDHQFDIFRQRYELHWTKGLIDVDKLKKWLTLFVGNHDYFCFSGLKNAERSSFQTIRSIESITAIRDQDNRIKIYFQAKGFIRYQIRMIVGACLQAYLNNPRSHEALIKLRLTGEGDKSPFIVDGKGLCLVGITYQQASEKQTYKED